MASSQTSTSMYNTSDVARLATSPAKLNGWYTVPSGHNRLVYVLSHAAGPSMALNDSSNMVRGLTPPEGLSRCTCTCILEAAATIPQALWVSMTSQYASCAHSRKNTRKAIFQYDGPGLDSLLCCMIRKRSCLLSGPVILPHFVHPDENTNPPWGQVLSLRFQRA